MEETGSSQRKVIDKFYHIRLYQVRLAMGGNRELTNYCGDKH